MAYTSEIDKLERRHRENPDGRTFAPLADAYRKAGDVQRALEILKTGLQLHPDYLSASIVLGRCHLDLGDLPSAEGAFRRVLDLDKENVIAIKALADITERQARFDESEHWLNYLLSIDGSNEEARLQLHRLDGVREEHSKLAAILEEAPVEETPAEPVAQRVVSLSFLEVETVEITPLRVTEPELPADEPAPEEPAFEEPAAQETLLEEPVHAFDAAGVTAPAGFMVHDEPPQEPKEELGVLKDEDPLAAGSSGGQHFDVGVERHEEIVLRPSATSEFQVPSDADLLGGTRSSGGFSPRFEENAPAPDKAAVPEPLEEAVTAEDLWQPHPEDATARAEDPAEEEAPVPETAPPGHQLVTETIGDVYAAQGHHAQALAVYRQLLARTPDDRRLGEKIDEMESRIRQAPPAQRPRGFSATETGGRSVLSYMGDLLSARILPDSNGSPNTAADPASEAASTGYMEEAFRTDEDAPVAGEPTRPASGPLSLSAIFGEDSSPVPPVVAGPDSEAPKPQASHFDEFFGERPTPQAGTTRNRSVRIDSDQDDLDQFHKWLKGLKR